jgi:hypothetical protein
MIASLSNVKIHSVGSLDMIRSIASIAIAWVIVGVSQIYAANNPEVSSVLLKVENNLINCMEEREITFSATTAITFHDGDPCDITYKLHVKGPVGGFEMWDDPDWAVGEICVFDEYDAPLVPRTGVKNYTLQAYATARDEEENYAEQTSNTLNIDVRRLWIDEFKDAATSKDWKVVVGKNIQYKAYASDDCVAWDWDMEDGVLDAWNPTGGNAKTGSAMKIPFSDLARAGNSWFGDRYGTVTVECEDGEGNDYDLESDEMEGNPHKAKVFFDPDKNVNGGTPTNAFPACWYVFWKDGGVVDELDEFEFSVDHPNYYGSFTPSTGILRVYHPLACGSNSGPETYTKLDLSTVQMTGSGKHLNCLAETMQHEMYHKYVHDEWNGDTDPDSDGLPTDEEATPEAAIFPTSDPLVYQSLTWTGSYGGDQETRCRIMELNLTLSTHPDKDWSADSENGQWVSVP